MLIEKVEIKNFRSIAEEYLDCEDITVLVGRNGAGKSSFLNAIDMFYDPGALVSDEDFFDHDTNNPIEIRITYTKLRSEELDEFSSYIRDDKLMVTKRIMFENGKAVQRYYAAAMQIPQFSTIRAILSKRDRITAWNELVARNELVGLSDRARSTVDVENMMAEYEAAHPELMEPVERIEQFFGPKNVGGGKLDKFTRYVLVPAVREASDEAQGKKGAISQILDMIILRQVNARGDVQTLKAEFDERIKQVYSSDNLKELPALGISISQSLAEFAPGSQLNLEWDDVKPPEITMPAAKATLIEDSFEGEISRKGHGLQRALVLTLLQHLAKLAQYGTATDESGEGTTITSESEHNLIVQQPDLILAIEEPELYLHPTRCRYLAELLLKLAERAENSSSSNQVIYTTHSPYFVDLHRFDKIRMVRKNISSDSVVPHSKVERFLLEEAAQEIAKVCELDPNECTRDSFRAHATSVMSTIVNEGFFADKVVVVEGSADVGILWKLQDIMGKRWLQRGISIIPAGGKNNIDRPTIIFNGFGIPTYFVFDADSDQIGKQGEMEAKRRNHNYLRLAGVQVEDFPDTQVHETWAVFGQNPESELRSVLGDEEFYAIRNQVAEELGYSSDPSQVNKNIEGSARFIEVVYEKGKNIPVLERIVEAITML